MSKAWTIAVVFVIACGGAGSEPPNSPQQRKDAEPAIAALKASKFGDAQREAGVVLGKDGKNSRAAAVRAIAAYQAAGHNLIASLTSVLRSAGPLKSFDHQAGRQAWLDFAKALAAIDADLAIAATDRDFSLELCIACWEHDWNRSGEIDDNDRKMFELEFDGKGGELAEGDPRRRPTIKFDVGDVEWARAMIAFQRAAVELVLAYKWSELDKLFSSDDDPKIVIRVAEPGRVKRARQLVLAGLAHADKCRETYLAETDDDREWVPNPRQKSYAMPLEVDDQLYQTWKGVLGDVRRLLESQEGISLREAKNLIDPSERLEVPDVYIDLGRMLREPKDIVFDIAAIKSRTANYEPFLRGLIGNGYQTKMRASPLVGRLRAMKNQLERGEDSLERKLRYLLWLN